jgi:hypothetical protein
MYALCSSFSGQSGNKSNKDHDVVLQYLENDSLSYSVDTFDGYALLPLFTIDSSGISRLPVVECLDDEDDKMTYTFFFASDHTAVLSGVVELATPQLCRSPQIAKMKSNDYKKFFDFLFYLQNPGFRFSFQFSMYMVVSFFFG